MGDADGTTTFPGMPFKHNSARRHRIPRARYRVTNWREYEAGLRRRGDLTLWLDEAAVAGWSAPTRSTPGGQPIYSDLAIELVLTVRRRRPADITLFYLWKGTSLEPLSSSKDQRLATPIGVGTPRRFTLLRRAFYDRTCTRRRVRLPSEAGIQVTGNTACAVLRLTTAAVQANMQDDAAAFESWVLVLMVWCGVRRVIIDWDEPERTAEGHYQRFLYRLRHFQTLLGPEVVEVTGPERLMRCRVGNGAAGPLISLARPARPSVPHSRTWKPTSRSTSLGPTPRSARASWSGLDWSGSTDRPGRRLEERCLTDGAKHRRLSRPGSCLFRNDGAKAGLIVFLSTDTVVAVPPEERALSGPAKAWYRPDRILRFVAYSARRVI